MVKGISRQVIVVRQPDAKLFEQAIFLLREDAAEGVTDAELLRQAKQAADGYLRRHAGSEKKCRRFPWNAAAFTLLGALATGLAWLATLIL